MHKKLSPKAEVVRDLFLIRKNFTYDIYDFAEQLWVDPPIEKLPKDWKQMIYAAISEAKKFMERNNGLSVRRFPKASRDGRTSGWKCVYIEKS